VISKLSLSITAEALRTNVDWKSPFVKKVCQYGPKFQVEEDVRYQPSFVSQN